MTGRLSYVLTRKEAERALRFAIEDGGIFADEAECGKGVRPLPCGICDTCRQEGNLWPSKTELEARGYILDADEPLFGWPPEVLSSHHRHARRRAWNQEERDETYTFTAQPVDGDAVKVEAIASFAAAARVFFEDHPFAKGVTISGGHAPLGFREHYTLGDEFMKAPLPASPAEQKKLRQTLDAAEKKVDMEIENLSGSSGHTQDYLDALKARDMAKDRYRQACGLPIAKSYYKSDPFDMNSPDASRQAADPHF